MLIERLYINASLNEPTILKLLADHCTDIVRNFLWLLDGRVVYYEPVPTFTKDIFRIIVSTSLRDIIFNIMHATPVSGHMGEYKTLYWILLRIFGIDYVLMILDKSRCIPTIYSSISRDDGNRN